MNNHSVPSPSSRISASDPMRVLEIELSAPLPAVAAINNATGNRYRRALALVRLFGQPIGIIELPLGREGLSADDCSSLIWDRLKSNIQAQLAMEGLREIEALTAEGIRSDIRPASMAVQRMLLASAPPVSVVIATHNRTDSLADCLTSLLAQNYPCFEIIVVDNAPRTSETADFIARQYGHDGRIRYVREDVPGLAVAHNRGLQEVKNEIVAFTDDDVRVDANWLTSIVNAFAVSEDVGCVTGMIFPAELETAAQVWLEQYSGFNKGFKQRIFNLHHHRPSDPLFPYTAGAFGSGANMAFRTEALHKMGGFDPALGAGSKAVGGDDLDAFFRVVAAGYTLVYEPAAIIHHWHRREYPSLQRQAYGYGIGLTAYLTSCLVNDPMRCLDIARRLPLGIRHIFSSDSPKNERKQSDYPRELDKLERKGMLAGPLAYIRSRWHTRELRLPTA